MSRIRKAIYVNLFIIICIGVYFAYAFGVYDYLAIRFGSAKYCGTRHFLFRLDPPLCSCKGRMITDCLDTGCLGSPSDVYCLGEIIRESVSPSIEDSDNEAGKTLVSAPEGKVLPQTTSTQDIQKGGYPMSISQDDGPVYFTYPKVDTTGTLWLTREVTTGKYFSEISGNSLKIYQSSSDKGLIEQLVYNKDFSSPIKVVRLVEGMNKTLFFVLYQEGKTRSEFFGWNNFSEQIFRLDLSSGKDEKLHEREVYATILKPLIANELGVYFRKTRFEAKDTLVRFDIQTRSFEDIGWDSNFDLHDAVVSPDRKHIAIVNISPFPGDSDKLLWRLSFLNITTRELVNSQVLAIGRHYSSTVQIKQDVRWSDDSSSVRLTVNTRDYRIKLDGSVNEIIESQDE